MIISKDKLSLKHSTLTNQVPKGLKLRVERAQRSNKMTLQQVVEELKNIKEQSVNDDEIEKEHILEAITDIIHEVEGKECDMIFDDEDDYGSYERETDFTQLVID